MTATPDQMADALFNESNQEMGLAVVSEADLRTLARDAHNAGAEQAESERDTARTELDEMQDWQNELAVTVMGEDEGDPDASQESIIMARVQWMQAELAKREAVIAAIKAWDGKSLSELDDEILSTAPTAALDAALAQAWDQGVAIALNHAIRNEDGITLRLEHLDGRPWDNPYRAADTTEGKTNESQD